eukprot:CAMPEP_0198146768 /NCGR_PEP_ID=MMETSP1443-20131203/31320_1 /TAXON_ID=186043 /ORGANISM="Entomoneis sp., Strain CCMP2396" /LENGTH=162 /DNA_ID=CAMNT_0043810841 /DNA_START=39 /DNA_END=527 /DNA_ORIENTATION=+
MMINGGNKRLALAFVSNGYRLPISRFATQPPTQTVRQSSSGFRHFASVTGSVYKDEENSAPSVVLFTKEGCTLCDKVKDVLASVRDQQPHSLDQVDITDKDNREWFQKYKYDIPVLHLNGKYWVKHRLAADQVETAFEAIQSGSFESPPGEPKAAEVEREKR